MFNLTHRLFYPLKFRLLLMLSLHNTGFSHRDAKLLSLQEDKYFNPDSSVEIFFYILLNIICFRLRGFYFKLLTLIASCSCMYYSTYKQPRFAYVRPVLSFTSTPLSTSSVCGQHGIQ